MSTRPHSLHDSTNECAEKFDAGHTRTSETQLEQVYAYFGGVIQGVSGTDGWLTQFVSTGEGASCTADLALGIVCEIISKPFAFVPHEAVSCDGGDACTAANTALANAQQAVAAAPANGQAALDDALNTAGSLATDAQENLNDDGYVDDSTFGPPQDAQPDPGIANELRFVGVPGGQGTMAAVGCGQSFKVAHKANNLQNLKVTVSLACLEVGFDYHSAITYVGYDGKRVTHRHDGLGTTKRSLEDGTAYTASVTDKHNGGIIGVQAVKVCTTVKPIGVYSGIGATCQIEFRN